MPRASSAARRRVLSSDPPSRTTAPLSPSFARHFFDVIEGDVQVSFACVELAGDGKVRGPPVGLCPARGRLCASHADSSPRTLSKSHCCAAVSLFRPMRCVVVQAPRSSPCTIRKSLSAGTNAGSRGFEVVVVGFLALRVASLDAGYLYGPLGEGFQASAWDRPSERCGDLWVGGVHVVVCACDECGQ